MAESKQDKHWDHTAAMLAMMANLHRDAKKRKKPFEPKEFKPTTAPKTKREPLEQIPISALKSIFVRGRK